MTAIEDVRGRLAEVRPPGEGRDVVSLGMVRGVDLGGGVVTVHFEARALEAALVEATLSQIRRALGALPGVERVDVRMEQPDAGAAGNECASIPGVRDVMAVASTKGGVGKSTVAVNLSLAMQARGQRVGLLDADVYGPSLPVMMGVSTRPRASSQGRIPPLEKYGLQLMSMGFFLDDQSPVIWRGPLVMGLVRQFLRDVEWHDLDLLVIDLPPGTGDAPLTLVQQVPLCGGVMVTTPQDVALIDVERGIAMFRQVNTPVLGVVENMSFYTCPRCGEKDEIFGVGGGQRLSERFGVPLLGRLPLVPVVRESGDTGRPVFVEDPMHPVSQVFGAIAAQVVAGIEAAREPAPRVIG